MYACLLSGKKNISIGILSVIRVRFSQSLAGIQLALFPGLHTQLLSLTVQKLGVEAWEQG